MRFHSRFALGIGFLAAAGAPALLRGQTPAPPSLGAAARFAVLGGSSVTSTGSTVITGNLGVSPGNAISGSSTVKIGAIYRNDSVARQAQRDATAAYNDLAVRTCTASVSTDLGGMILRPGVYCLSAARLTFAPLLLDGANDPNAVWIFRIASTLTTASSVRVINGGHESHIFWQAGNSVTLGADTAFLGNVLSLKDIALGNGTSVSGRLLAQGTVSLADNNVSLCCGDIVLSPGTLPNGVEGTPYSQQIAASGGVGNYTFTSVAQPPLSGLSLSAKGVLSGVPAAGRFTFTVTATDSNVCSATRTYTIDVVCPTRPMSPSAIPPAPSVPFVLPAATACIPYMQTFSDGCTLAHNFVLTAAGPAGGPIPSQLDAASGVLLWTPKKSGDYTFTVSDGSVSQIYQVSVGCEAISISPLTLPDGQVCAQYDQPITATGCDPPYVLSIENPPPGLGLNQARNAITGMPTKRGTYSFPIKATDDDDPACFTTRNYTINITCPPISIAPRILPPATTCQRYCVQLTSSCAIGAAEFKVTGGALPPGLSLSSDGMLCGNPSAEGTYSWSVTFTDTESGCTANITYTLAVTGLTITPATLPTATPGLPYNETLTASGGTAPYTFTLSGSLPAGLTFTQTTPTTATITGTPATVGCSTVTVTVTDANGNACSVTLNYTICTAAGGPTLTGWGMVVLSILLAGAGFLMIRTGEA